MNEIMKTIYLDHAATTRVTEEVYACMEPYWKEKFGNAGGIYGLAVDSKKAINVARREMAKLLQIDASELFFSSGGTEADNWAITGAFFASKAFAKKEPVHIVTSAFEHHAVLETCEFLKHLGVEVTYLNPDKDGFIDAEQLAKAIKPCTVLVSIMMANNEIGTIQPIRELAKVAHEKGCLFHTDAVQTMGHYPCLIHELDVDLLSASGHKFGAPKGIGFLYVKQGTALEPFMHGGGQERGRRAGTENVAGIVGMSEAIKRRENTEFVEKLRNHMAERILNEIEETYINGAMENRLAGNLNVGIRGTESESVLLHLNRYGICASGGSACTSSIKTGSHVLLSLGRTEEEANSAIRFTLGDDNTIEDIDYTVDVLKKVVAELRAMRL